MWMVQGSVEEWVIVGAMWLIMGLELSWTDQAIGVVELLTLSQSSRRWRDH